MSDFETILYVRDDRDKFATITLNRPDKLNAMNKTMVREIDAAVAAAVADPLVNALVITGAGRAFSSGYDMQGGDFDVDIDFWREDMAENAAALLNIWRAPIPVIASVHGYALAGGLELMMCCDLAIAADDAKFGEPEVRHNSGPPALMMPWLLATRDVRWLMYTGDLVDAEEALRMHRAAFGDDPVLAEMLDAGGEYAWRARGEEHMWTLDPQARANAGSGAEIHQGLDQQPADGGGAVAVVPVQRRGDRGAPRDARGAGLDEATRHNVAQGVPGFPRRAVRGPGLTAWWRCVP